MKNLFIWMGSILGIIIIIPMILIQSCDIQKSPIQKSKEKILKIDQKVHVYLQNEKKVETLDLEEYVKGVISGEMPATFEMEALKAQAVAARSYAVSRMNAYKKNGNQVHPKAELCDTVHCQVWLSKEKLTSIKSEQWMSNYWSKIEEAVEETRGMIMTYDDKPIDQPLFHSTSGGKTENSEDVFAAWVPYLRSVESPYEKDAPHFTDNQMISVSDFVSKIKQKYNDCIISPSTISTDIQIVERSEGGRILKIKVGNKILKGREIRELFGLRSANFKMDIQGDQVKFTTVGYGHGVGMSQWGANGMAKEGYSFEDILKHYYVGVEIEKLK
ncbi:stage II sporulation protein D [Inediibacterium massiliense]|uniref:stage II sporulation protein D n=1 Tax=Inediibacterium massiliense TaxID=1658111 RepID=UPI0006B53543|nr:stage II sporulation protein D [Inediibacterium massiliense]